MVIWGVVLLGLLRGVASVPLIDPDEGRNAEVAREMALTNDYVVPHFNGLPYLDKPISFFASTALAIEVLGPTELAARAAPMGFTLAATALVMAFGWRRFGRDTALLAGLALVTSPLVVAFSHITIFDSTMMFWVSASCFAAYRAWDGGGTRWFVVAWAAMGMAVLTKGPVGLVLIVLINVAFALTCRRRLRSFFHPAGLAAFVVVVAPWFLAVTAQHPEFPHYAFVRETFQRVATDRMQRTGPPYYFVVYLIAGALPWVLLWLSAPGRMVEAWRERAAAAGLRVYLLLWVLVPILFFTLSQSKRPGYILPVFPALALLVADAFAASPAARKRAAWLFAGLGAILAAAFLILAGRVGSMVDQDYRTLAEIAPRFAVLLGVAFGILAVVGAVAAWKSSRTAIIVCFALFPLTLPVLGADVVHAVAADRSARALAEAIQEIEPAGVRVVGVGAFPPSLPYYLDDVMLLATSNGGEMRSNYIEEYAETLRDAPGSTLRSEDWWRNELERCPEPTVFVVSRRDGERSEILATALPEVAVNRRFAVYGPCEGVAR